MHKLAMIIVLVATIITVSAALLAEPVADSAGVEPVSAVGMSCKKPFALTQDCSRLSGPKKKIFVGGHQVKVAGNADGTITVLLGTTGSIARQTVNVGYYSLKSTLVEKGFQIVRVTPIKSFGSVHGYAIETTESSYQIWDEFTAVAASAADEKAQIVQADSQGQATAWSDEAMGEVATTLQLKDELEWELETDVGTMHFYGGDELWSVDLMRNGELLMDPIPLSGMDDARTVRHIPRTNILLIASTRGDVAGKVAEKRDGADRRSRDKAFSCAIDLFSGEILWRKSPLEVPDEVHYFPDARTVILRSFPNTKTASSKKSSKFTAVDLDTGEVRWTNDYPAQAVWVNGPFLEIVGKKTVSLDAVTGKETRTVNLPLPGKTMLMAFPAQEKILTWKKKDFSLFEIPTLTSEQVTEAKQPISIDAKMVWQMKTRKKLDQVQVGFASGPKYVSDKLLLINFLNFMELINFETGESIWGRKKKLASMGQDLEISPTRTYGAITKGKELFVIDMNTGLDLAQIAIPNVSLFKTPYRRIMWQGNDELVVVFSDRKQRPQNITRINVSENSIVWTKTLSGAAKFRKTTKEKGKLTAGIFLAVAAIAVSANSSHVTLEPNTNTYFAFVPNLNVKLIPDSSAELDALEARVANAGKSQKNMALRRYVERAKLIANILGKKGLFAAGKEDRYQIVNFDLATGNTKIVAEYSAPKVHGIEPDIVYGLAIIQEQNRKKINVMSLKAKSDH